MVKLGTFRAIVPSGASVGDYEAHELRDGDKGDYGGNSVHQAVTNVEKIIGPALMKRQFDVGTGLADIDRFMIQLDGSKNKTKLGANAMLGVSMACARAGAAAKVNRIRFFLLTNEDETGLIYVTYRASRCMSF